MMFKIISRQFPEFLPKEAILRFLRSFLPGLLWVLLASLAACRTGPPLPKVNLSEPGWTVRQGQAVWHPRRNAPELAGDLLVATRPDGPVFVQFTKTPFPFAIAQTTPTHWQIEIPPQNRRFSGPGKPPARIVWFQLANALTEKPVAKSWSWQTSQTGWHLENKSTGESLDGYLTQ